MSRWALCICIGKILFFFYYRFKKPKKKVKKVRQKLKADDLMPLPGDKLEHSAHLGRRQRSRITDPDDEPDASPDAYADIKIEEEDDDLEVILAKARRLKQKEALITKTLTTSETDAIKVEDIKSEPDHSDLDGRLGATDIVLNATAEFCRTLGDIPTYGMSGNRDVDAVDMMDDDDDVVPMDTEEVDADQAEEERSTGTWNSVNPDLVALADSDKIHEKIRSEVAILDEEPDVGSGVGAALKLALSKGYLEKEDQNRPSNTRMAHLQAKNYSIDDKAHNDDEKFQRRDRFQHGPISDFKEKDSYRPNVKLEYIDDSGRLLNEKEAFRYLSHKFHGKGPGKNKIEKRLKKNEQDGVSICCTKCNPNVCLLKCLCVFFCLATHENELDRHAARHVDDAEAQTTGDAQSVHCAEWQQTNAAEHQHCQA